MFYAESIKHGVKAVTQSVNHTIGIRYIVREDWLSNGVVIKTQMERESSNECSVFFLWTKESVWLRNRPSRNSTMFSSRRSAKCTALKFNQGSEVFEDFSGTFFTLWSRKLRF